MGELVRRLLLILSTLSSHFLIGYGQDVFFEYTDHCYVVNGTVTMKAVYKGSGSVTGVEWYYSGRTAANMFVDVSNCDVFGAVPDGYPERSRMSFDCQAATKTYTLSLTGLKQDELQDIWGATFTVSGLPSPSIAQSTLSECETTTVSDCGCKSLDNCDISEGVCILLWFIIGILIAAVLIIVIILILHYCFDVKIPCCTCCKRKKTSSNEGEPPGTQNGEGQILHNQDTQNSAYYTNKRPLAKLEQLDEPESEKPHIGGRPLPQIGKHN